jgi:endonuclease III related protein
MPSAGLERRLVSGSARGKHKPSRRNDVPWIYRRLLREFGPQGWWPVTPPGGRRPCYSLRCTRGEIAPRQKFEIAAGAILTQNTAWSNVEKALINLAGRRLLSSRRILKAPIGELRRLLRPSGYFRQKSRRLKNFCRVLESRWGGRLDKFLDRPSAQVRRELLTLNGVGPETADSIMLYAGRHPVFVVDAYTRRFGRRFGLFRAPDYDRVQEYFSARLKPDLSAYREAHALLVALGKKHCRPRPVCAPCPLSSRCRTGLAARRIS